MIGKVRIIYYTTPLSNLWKKNSTNLRVHQKTPKLMTLKYLLQSHALTACSLKSNNFKCAHHDVDIDNFSWKITQRDVTDESISIWKASGYNNTYAMLDSGYPVVIWISRFGLLVSWFGCWLVDARARVSVGSSNRLVDYLGRAKFHWVCAWNCVGRMWFRNGRVIM